MKPQTLLLAIIAVGCGLAAMVMTQRMLSSSKAKRGAQVVVAAGDLQSATRLNAAMVEVVDRPKEYVPDGAFASAEEVANRVVRYPLAKGEVITERKLAPKDAFGGLEAVLDAGQRAVSVEIKLDRAVAGFIRPHSRVDVVLSTKSTSKQPGRTKTILQNVEVLAVNQQIQRDGSDTGPPRRTNDHMITFLLDQQQAEMLFAASNMGDLALTLRSNVDPELVRTRGASSSDVLHAGTEDASRDVPQAGPFIAQDEGKNKPGLFENLSKVMQKVGEQAEEGSVTSAAVEVADPEPGAPVVPRVAAIGENAQAAPTEQVPDIDMKRLVIRDDRGNELMKVLLPADSDIVPSIDRLLEDASQEDLKGLSPKRRAALAKQQAAKSKTESSKDKSDVRPPADSP